MHILDNLYTRRFIPLFDNTNDAGGASSSASSSGDAASGGGAPDGGAATPPASSPAADTTPPAENMFAGLADDFDNEDSIAVAPAPVTNASELPAPVVPPVTTPAAPPAAAPVPPAQPAPAAPTTPATTPEPSAQTQSAPLPSPDRPAELADAMIANMPAIVSHLAQTRFALTEAEVAELETDATTAVPKLLARAHVEAQAAAMKFIAQSVPGMIARHMQTTQANTQAQDKFFSAFPGLDKTNNQHVETATRIVSLYRGMHPDAKMEEVIQICGPMVLTAIGATSAPAAAAPPAGAPAPRPPGMVPPAPFRPAMGGGGANPPPVAAEPNPWAGMGGVYDEE